MRAGDAEPLQAYLGELAGELRLPSRLRRRVLAEVADHLLEAAEAERRRGRPPAAAAQAVIERFGPSRELAGRFLDQVAAASAHRASDATAAALAGMCLVALPFLALMVPVMLDFPYGAVTYLAAQVALVAGGLGLLRSLARRRAARLDRAELRLLLRGDAIAVAAIAAGLLAETLLALRQQDGLAGPTLTALSVMLAATWLLNGFAGLAVARAAARAAKVTGGPAQAAPPAGGDVLDDLAVVGELVRELVERRLPALRQTLGLGCRLGRRARALAVARVPWLLPWLDLRGHPWRFCALVAGTAVVCCFAGAAASAPEGGLALGGPLAGALVEGAAVVGGFALLGGFLGIRRPGRT